MSIFEWVLGIILIMSSLGVILLKNPVHACMSFLLTLLAVSVLYLALSAQFIAAMQILVYAGAILVIFMFVIVLFQDAYRKISQLEAKSFRPFLILAAATFVLTFLFLGRNVVHLPTNERHLTENFGTVQALGQALYVDYFFPFEAVILLFLISAVGALYIAKREKKEN